MYTLPSLKHNSFQKVNIPSPSDLFKRYGMSKRGGTYSGDTSAPQSETKIETLDRIMHDVNSQEIEE